MLLVWIAVVLVHPRPFWVHFYDPELAYINSGLRLLAGQIPHHVDHPGTPLQLLSAVILMATGRDPAAVERFRLVGYVLALSMSVGAAWLLLRTVLEDVSRLVAISAIWAYSVTPQALQYLSVWSPEILIFPFGAVASAAAWRLFSEPDRRRALGVGLAVGACLSLKLTFAGWIPALVVALLSDFEHTLRRRVEWVLAACAGTILAFVLMTAAVLPEYPRMLALPDRLAEAYAPATPVADLMSALARVVRGAEGWSLLFLASTVIALFLNSPPRARRSMIVFCALGIGFTLVLVARQGGAVRYLLPAGPLMVALVAVAGGRLRRFAPVLAIGVAALLAKASMLELTSHSRRLHEQTSLRTLVDDGIDSICGPERRVLFGWRLPSPSLALRILVTDGEFRRRVAQRYPSDGYLDPWSRQIVPPAEGQNWDIAVLSDQDAAHFPEPLGEPVRRISGFGFFTYGFYPKGPRCVARTEKERADLKRGNSRPRADENGRPLKAQRGVGFPPSQARQTDGFGEGPRS